MVNFHMNIGFYSKSTFFLKNLNKSRNTIFYFKDLKWLSISNDKYFIITAKTINHNPNNIQH